MMIAQDFVCRSTRSEHRVLWSGIVIHTPDGITSDLAAIFCSLVAWLCKTKTLHDKQKAGEGARYK